MKMAKAGKADLEMAMSLASALDALGQRFFPCIPGPVEHLIDGEESEPFDRDNDAQCGRALRHLLTISERGSLARVVWGMSTLLDPKNKVVDPAKDTLEHHPDVIAALAALAQKEG